VKFLVEKELEWTFAGIDDTFSLLKSCDIHFLCCTEHVYGIMYKLI